LGPDTTEPATTCTHAVLSFDNVVLIQQFKLWLEKEGYSPKTTKSSISNLKSLARHSDFNDPESVKSEIAKRDVTNGARGTRIR